MSDLTPYFRQAQGREAGFWRDGKAKCIVLRPIAHLWSCSRGLLWPETRIPDRLRPDRSQQASADEVAAHTDRLGTGLDNSQGLRIFLPCPFRPVPSSSMPHVPDMDHDIKSLPLCPAFPFAAINNTAPHLQLAHNR